LNCDSNPDVPVILTDWWLTPQRPSRFWVGSPNSPNLKRSSVRHGGGKRKIEGSGYQIIETLACDGVLSLFDVIMLEWHDNAKNQRLISNLLKNGFRVLSLNPNSPTVGAMYAFKPPRRN
jgi:hypothetical protein